MSPPASTTHGRPASAASRARRPYASAGLPGGTLPEQTSAPCAGSSAATASSYAAHAAAEISGPGSLSTVVRPSRSITTAVERSSPSHGTARSSTPSPAIIPAPTRPVSPGTKPTSSARTPSDRAARATFRPFPPGVTTTRSKRSTSPGRSASIVPVRSSVRFGPAISMRCGIPSRAT